MSTCDDDEEDVDCGSQGVCAWYKSHFYIFRSLQSQLGFFCVTVAIFGPMDSRVRWDTTARAWDAWMGEWVLCETPRSTSKCMGFNWLLKKIASKSQGQELCTWQRGVFGCVLKQWKCVGFIFICIYQSVCRYCHNTSDAAYINTTMAFECTICLVYKQFIFLLSCILKCAFLICIYSLHYRSCDRAYYAQYSCQPIATVYLHNKQDKWHFECWLLTLLHTLTL